MDVPVGAREHTLLSQSGKHQVEVLFTRADAGETCPITLDDIGVAGLVDIVLEDNTEAGNAAAGEDSNTDANKENRASVTCPLSEHPELLVVQLPCKHRFNGLALCVHWAKMKMQCPMCNSGDDEKMSIVTSFPGESWAMRVFHRVMRDSKREMFSRMYESEQMARALFREELEEELSRVIVSNMPEFVRNMVSFQRGGPNPMTELVQNTISFQRESPMQRSLFEQESGIEQESGLEHEPGGVGITLTRLPIMQMVPPSTVHTLLASSFLQALTPLDQSINETLQATNERIPLETVRNMYRTMSAPGDTPQFPTMFRRT